ncbi:uncharacterized protein LOC114722371 [Neltuma alba]|uniref:uncharacterized protein LOC114722371 n=1 Tax=Neltuma alba TaxID=207710 RepID=UPI0010A35B08|nr:uncharacterized protein LOC114722371 [Prosopis alba]
MDVGPVSGVIIGWLIFRAVLASTLWSIWKSRNRFLYQNVTIDPVFTFKQAEELIQEYWTAKGWNNATDAINEGAEKKSEDKANWSLPHDNALKINVDCALTPDEAIAAIAFVVRDSNGWVLDGASRIIAADSSLMAKGAALQLAMNYAYENDLDEVIFESDNQNLINCLNNNAPSPGWRNYVILENLQFSRNRLRSHSCSWIPKEANSVADWVARASLAGSCPTDWVMRPPPLLRKLIESDLCKAKTNVG